MSRNPSTKAQLPSEILTGRRHSVWSGVLYRERATGTDNVLYATDTCLSNTNMKADRRELFGGGGSQT